MKYNRIPAGPGIWHKSGTKQLSIMTNNNGYLVHTAINARGISNKGNFSLLKWQREAYTGQRHPFRYFNHLINLIILDTKK
jgi:hypothetical protein